MKTSPWIFDLPEPIGALTVEEMLLFYDGPYVFFATGKGTTYMGVFADAYPVTYLFAPLSAEDYENLTTDKVDIRSVFARKETVHAAWCRSHWNLSTGMPDEKDLPDGAGFVGGLRS